MEVMPYLKALKTITHLQKTSPWEKAVSHGMLTLLWRFQVMAVRLQLLLRQLQKHCLTPNPTDTVQVSAGVYQERFTLRTGISLIGDGADTTMIDGGGASGTVIDMEPGTIIDGFTITGSGSGTFHAGIWHSAGPVTIRRNHFVDNSVGVISWCWDATCAAEAILENNIFTGNSGGAINANTYPIVKFVNNTVVDNGRGLVLNNPASIAENNIVVDNTGDGIAVFSQGATVRYNDVWNNGNNYVGITPEASNISTDPSFLDQVVGNYSLSPGSPAIDAGNPAPAYNDQDGSRCDMGAFGGPFALTAQQQAPCQRLDINSDSFIDLDDINEVLSHSIFTNAPYDSRYDITGDGVVDIADIFEIAVHFGETCP